VNELRSENCPECGAERAREYVIRNLGKGNPVPRGFRVEKRIGQTRVISAPTSWTTLCDCDV